MTLYVQRVGPRVGEKVWALSTAQRMWDADTAIYLDRSGAEAAELSSAVLSQCLQWQAAHRHFRRAQYLPCKMFSRPLVGNRIQIGQPPAACRVPRWRGRLPEVPPLGVPVQFRNIRGSFAGRKLWCIDGRGSIAPEGTPWESIAPASLASLPAIIFSMRIQRHM